MGIFATSICCVDAHLAAGEASNNIEQRSRDLQKVVAELRLEKQHTDRLKTREVLSEDNRQYLNLKKHFQGDTNVNMFENDLVLLAGDFNSRMWADRNMTELTTHADVFARLQAGQLQALMKGHDELTMQKATDRTFSLFKEAAINFIPTYKCSLDDSKKSVEYGGDRFVCSRVPAWTDRVLWHARGVELTPSKYERISAVTVSDHRPVRLGLQIVANKVQWSKLS